MSDDGLDGLRFLCECGHHLQSHEDFGKENRCIVVGCRCVGYTREEVTT